MRRLSSRSIDGVWICLLTPLYITLTQTCVFKKRENAQTQTDKWSEVLGFQPCRQTCKKHTVEWMASCMEANTNRRVGGLRSDTLWSTHSYDNVPQVPDLLSIPSGIGHKKKWSWRAVLWSLSDHLSAWSSFNTEGGKRRQVSYIQLQECLHPQERSQLNLICLADVLFPVVPRMFSLQQ